jgi:hypothetical protein
MPWSAGEKYEDLQLDISKDAGVGEFVDSDGVPLFVLPTQVEMDDALQAAFDAENRREEEDEGESECAELEPFPDQPIPSPLPAHFTTQIQHQPSKTSAAFQHAPPGTGSQGARSKAGKAARQKKNRKRLKLNFGAYDYKMRSSLSKKWSKPHVTEAKHGILNFAKSGYIGRPMSGFGRIVWTLKLLREMSFDVVQWDGR